MDSLPLSGLVVAIVSAPLTGAAFLLLFGKRVGRWAGHVASAAVGLSFVFGAASLVGLVGYAPEAREHTARLWEWLAVGNLRVGVDLRLDVLSIVMTLVVAGVGALIHVYSIAYMAGDPRYPRYFAYLNLFVASMLLLVLADNLVWLYVGWEGVGLCSYLLIGFWFERSSAANAAKKAFIVTRIGDVAFLIGIFLLVTQTGSVALDEVNRAAGALGAGTATVAALLLFAGATGKSAQIPLYVWLPDAMEGPTPVSALIHAATMVTAGVYVVARMAPVFEASGGAALAVVGWIGAVTALWAALMAAAEYDIKRVLAYSTISQLGYMFLAMGVQAYAGGIFHLVTHAFFKATMFLSAGAVMHGAGGETDMRALGGLRRAMPVTGAAMMAGGLALAGIAPFSGFFSKDAILASAWGGGSYALWGVGIVTALVTAFYMFRLYFRVFAGPRTVAAAHDPPSLMKAALIPLAVLAAIGGAVNLPGALTLEGFLEPVLGASEILSGPTPWLLGATALAVSLAGVAAAWALYGSPVGERRRVRIYRRLSPIVDSARAGFYVDGLYGRVFVLPGKHLASFAAYVVDEKVIDGVVNGVASSIAGIAEVARRVQSGHVRRYALVFLFGVVLMFSYLVLRAA